MHLAANADRVVGPIAHIEIGLGRGPHIGADAAEPEQIGWRLQESMHQFRGRCGFGRKADQGLHFCDSGMDLAARVKMPPPLMISALS